VGKPAPSAVEQYRERVAIGCTDCRARVLGRVEAGCVSWRLCSVLEGGEQRFDGPVRTEGTRHKNHVSTTLSSFKDNRLCRYQGSVCSLPLPNPTIINHASIQAPQSHALVILRANPLWYLASSGQSASEGASFNHVFDRLTFLRLARANFRPVDFHLEYAALRSLAAPEPSRLTQEFPATNIWFTARVCGGDRCLKLPQCGRAITWLHFEAREAGARARVDSSPSATRQDWRRIPAYRPRRYEQCLLHWVQDKSTRCYRSATYTGAYNTMW
jgi:hypothetical protein